jgi:hypothetical protein
VTRGASAWAARGLRAAAVAIVVLGAATARAGEDPKGEAKPKPTVALTAGPIFGPDAAMGAGWLEIVARLENTSTAPQKGMVELSTATGFGSDNTFSARAPFNVPAGRTAIVRLPAHGAQSYMPAWLVTVKNEQGNELARTTLNVQGTIAPLLVDVDQPARLNIALRGWPIPTPYNPALASGGYYGAATAATTNLTVGAPSFDRTTGDPILPEHAAGYASVTTVLIHSDALAKLEAAQLDALVGWVLGGGSLAVVVNRPEDLRGPTLSGLVGGMIVPGPVNSTMLSLPGAVRGSGSTPSFNPLDNPPPGGNDEDDPATPMRLTPAPGGGRRGSPFVPITRSGGGRAWGGIGPTTAVREKLVGFLGANLRPSDVGASAFYGLGEVHLLAFDPTTAPQLEDPWVHARVVDMIARAYERRSFVALPQGGSDRGYGHLDNVRRELDPNENFRPGLGISAILLVLYSIFVGPVLFSRSAKRGKLFAPLIWAPILSAATFGAIVVTGLASKGWRGRARHMSMVETAAGMTRGTVRRYRGFFASETRSLAVASTDRGSVLDVAATDYGRKDSERAILRVDRNGATLEKLTSLPWQTVVVREDGTYDFKGGVTVTAAPDGSVDVVNKTGLLLRDVVVWVPRLGFNYFAEVKAGEKIHASDGRSVMAASSRATSSSAGRTVHTLNAVSLGYGIGSSAKGEKWGQTWLALENAGGTAVDWWPDNLPVVLAEAVGAEKARYDSGLSLESDRIFLRVVGKGGAP